VKGMKYIRTKDGKIIDVSEMDEYETEDDKGNRVFDGFGNGKVYFPVEDILKQSDKIEELSDCFIAVDKNGCLCEAPMVARGRSFKSFCNYYKANHMNVECYLAILTDKGLIFVAKMNEEWKVELL